MKSEPEEALGKLTKRRFRGFLLFSFLFLGLIVLGNIGCNKASEACIWNDTEWNNCNWQ